MFLLSIFFLCFNFQLMAADVSSNSDVFGEVQSGVTLGDLKEFIIAQRNKTSLFMSSPSNYISWKTLAMATFFAGGLLADAHKHGACQCPKNILDFPYKDFSSLSSSGTRCVRGLLEVGLCLGGLSALALGKLYETCQKKLDYYHGQMQVSFFRSPDELATPSDLTFVMDDLINELKTSSESPLLNKLTPDQLFGVIRLRLYDYGQSMIDLAKEKRFKNTTLEKLIELSEKPLKDLESDLANNDVLKQFGEKGNFCHVLWVLLLPSENQTPMIRYRLGALLGLISHDEFNKLVNLSKMTLQDLTNELSNDDVVEGIKDVKLFRRRLWELLPPENRKQEIKAEIAGT